MLLQFDDSLKSEFTDRTRLLNILQDVLPLVHHHVRLVGAHAVGHVAAARLLTPHPAAIINLDRLTAITGHCHYITDTVIVILGFSLNRLLLELCLPLKRISGLLFDVGNNFSLQTRLYVNSDMNFKYSYIDDSPLNNICDTNQGYRWSSPGRVLEPVGTG